MDLQEANKKRRRNNRLVVWCAIAMAAIIGITAGLFGAFGTNTEAEAKDKVSITSAELKEILDVANAPLKDKSCTAIIERTGGVVIDDTYALLLETLKGVKEGDTELRQWSNSMSTVLRGKSTEEKYDYIQRAICEEPLIGVSLAHLFAHLKVGDVSVLSIQSTDWLKPYKVDTSEIDALAAGFMPLTKWKLENLRGGTAPEEVYVEAITANHEYQELASRLNLLLSKYELVDVRKIASTHHYQLAAGGLVADGFPEVEISSEVDNRPVLVFHLTSKTDECTPMSVLGFNTGDKRPMIGKLVNSCEEEKPATPPTPKGGGDDTPKGCTEDCGDTPEPPEACPPGQTGTPPNCLEPKSDNPNDYRQPGDGGKGDDVGTGTKPPAPAPEEPASNPAPVQTEQTGGGGVVDKPTNNPGSETGVKAPGSTPTPTTPTPKPPNEGGNNNGAVDSGF